MDRWVDLDAAALRRRCEELPVFPLPGAALLPGALLPLHVFEPRYRALIARCVEGDGVLGLPALLPGLRTDADGPLAIRPVFGVGRLVAHRALPDGRSQIVVKGLATARAVGEGSFAEGGYRVLPCEPHAEAAGDETQVVRHVRELILMMGAARLDTQEEAGRLYALGDRDLIEELARRMFEDLQARWAFLEAPSQAARARLIHDALGAAMIPGGEPRVDA